MKKYQKTFSGSIHVLGTRGRGSIPLRLTMNKEEMNDCSKHQHCPDCLAHYTGSHTCPPLLKAIVTAHKKKITREYEQKNS